MKLLVLLCGLICAVTAIPGTPPEDPSEYGLFYRMPPGCDPPTDCMYYVGMEVNAIDSAYLDVYLTASVTGWVAVGFSLTPSMPDSDVIGCIMENSIVVAIDTYNVPTGGNTNMLDPDQADIILGSGAVAGDRITCTLSRLIAGLQAPPVDRNLNDSYFPLFGFNSQGRGPADSGFSIHGFAADTLPTALASEFNPVVDTGELPLMTPTEPPADVSAPVILPQDFRLRRRDPSGCDPENCDFFMGINTNGNNSDFLDFYLTADINGWVAVGFSPSANMFDADVVGCNRLPGTDNVFVVDTSNPASGRSNSLDVTQDIVVHNASFVDGRITCIFSRSILGSDDPPQDRPLNTDYYFLFGVGNDGRGNRAFSNHVPLIPPVSDGQYNPATDSVDIPPPVDPSEYGLFYRMPPGCDPPTDCMYYVGMEVNASDSAYLDVYLTASVTGWVAVGFSLTPSMRDSDVIGCIMENSIVVAIDTYNVPTGGNTNMLDPDQGDIILVSGEVAGDRITCTLSRLIAGLEAPSVDRNLNDSYFPLFGFHSEGRGPAGGFSMHGLDFDTLPTALASEFNPVVDTGELPLMTPTEPPANVSAPVIQPQDFRLRRRDPSGCDPENCDFFMGINTNGNNSDFLDFYLTADINGWVAVGFSPSANMFNADVVGCNHQPGTDDVFVVDTSNPTSGRSNSLDATQDIVVHNASFVDGRITCIFSRSILGSDNPPQDRPLNTSYYFLFGVGNDGTGNGAFSNHVPLIPPVSDGQYNPATDSVDIPSPVDPSEYGLFYRMPPGCDPPTDCMYYVGMEVNASDSAYLDVYLTASVAGWVAVGFSLTPSMRDSDVIGCIMENSIVVAIDTYNVPTGGNTNMLDPDQGDIILVSGEVAGDRITCTLSRLIAGLEAPSVDRNLNDSYFPLFGFHSEGRGPAGGFSMHGLDFDTLPTALASEFNPVVDTGELPLMTPTEPPANVSAPVIQPQDFRLRRRDPSGCDPENCDFFMGINTNGDNSDFLDFYLTADINGWVAVGFSPSANMFDADVVGCNHQPGTDNVFVVDTSNPTSGRSNSLDATQDIVVHSASFVDGRITCIFSRSILGSDNPPQDRPLNTDYYFLFGVGNDGTGNGAFSNHVPLIPPVSDGRFDPATDSGDIGISRLRQQLLQAHGILMLIAWPLLAFTAIFFAAWMKQALPNGEWFQVHRAFHIAAILVAVIGFILAFVANMDADTPGLITLGSDNKSGTAHYVFGIIIMALQIANPIISIFRCKPTGQYRWIFNITHGFFVGLGVEFLAYINIGIGVSIFSETQSEFGDLTIFWVYLAFAIFGVVLNVGLLLFFTFEACFKGEDGVKLAPAVLKPIFNEVYGSVEKSPPQGVELRGPGEQEKPAEPPPRKPPSKDAPIRWLALGLFLGIMLPLVFAVIVMIAATGNLTD